MKRWLLAAAVVAAASVVGTAVSSPTTPTFDRGMPTTNLNNAAGANRSNVAWSFGNDYVTGDNFKIGATGEKYYITTLRTWNVGESSGMPKLYLGTSVGIAEVPGLTVNRTPVKYTGNLDYQTTGGSLSQIYQNDFQNVGWVAGGVTNYFAVDGTPASPTSYWFNHASNALLSGSTQQGADGTFNYWAKNALSAAPGSWDSNGGGWDKSSDINVQVFASQEAKSKDGCKNGGWQSLVRSDSSTFKNQGDCIQYVNTGK